MIGPKICDFKLFTLKFKIVGFRHTYFQNKARLPQAQTYVQFHSFLQLPQTDPWIAANDELVTRITVNPNFRLPRSAEMFGVKRTLQFVAYKLRRTRVITKLPTSTYKEQMTQRTDGDRNQSAQGVR